ncbi:MAG: Trp family transcriptional regulator [Candidatus Jorgensenbacteria bacterium]
MSATAKLQPRKKWEGLAWQKFLETAERASSDRKLNLLLDSVLSASEKRLMVRRLAIMALIGQGKTYREIGRRLWLSPSTVSAIKKGMGGHSLYRSRRESDKEARKRKRGAEKKPVTVHPVLEYWLNMPPISGKGRWKFLDCQR